MGNTVKEKRDPKSNLTILRKIRHNYTKPQLSSQGLWENITTGSGFEIQGRDILKPSQNY
jgi:hypothetical protein